MQAKKRTELKAALIKKKRPNSSVPSQNRAITIANENPAGKKKIIPFKQIKVNKRGATGIFEKSASAQPKPPLHKP